MAAAACSPTSSGSVVLKAVAGLPPPDLCLPALQPVKSRDQYRERPEAEMEEATWYSADEPDTFAEPQQVRLRSIHSKQATVVTFTNKSSRRVRALWVDFKGNEVAYSVLEPGNTKRYHTYVTHPWIVRELHSATRMMLSGRPAVVGLSTEQTVEIQEPPVLNWSLSSHAAFPEPYKSSVRGLLLAHKALEPHAAATQGPASLDALAARSILQSPRKRTAYAPIRPASSPADDSCAAPCKRLCPVSPRASLLSHHMAPAEGPGPALPPLSPAGPKAYASLPAAFTATATHNKASHHQTTDDAYTTTTTSISISSEASHFTATLTVSSPRRASVKSTVNIELAGAGGSNRTTVNFDTFMTDVQDDQAQQHDAAASAPCIIDQLLPRPAAAATASVDNSCSQPEMMKKPSRGLLGMLKLCTAPATTSPRNMLKNLLSRPGVPHNSSKPMFANDPISSQQLTQPAGNSSLALDVRLRPVYTNLKVQVQQQCDDMLLDDVSAADACWPPIDTHLGNLPSHLLVYIAELAAPMMWQSLAAVPLGRPDVKPTLMACPPITAEEQQQLDEQEQQQADQQQQQAGNN